MWAQSNENFVRLVEIEVDPNQISAYKQLLNESINTSVSVEEGVLQYHVVTDKKTPFDLHF
jgi:quinol monooxygenase YgiN